ncbi:MAG: IPT/TIG domain-containing protein [Treponema sp.]|jgi:transglutaminase-like putative cysteine protease|nr:IPT/TIG domain-containing protein [Treponema sp.]
MKLLPILCAFALIAAALTSCGNNGPRIESIYPTIGRLGEPLVIRGQGFGDFRGEYFVTIAGIQPTSSAYLSWGSDEIVLRLPDFASAGLVRVHRGRNISNAVLFSNEDSLPSLPRRSGEDSGINTRITSIEPDSAPVGSLVTIRGNNFGSSREEGVVFFSWNAPPGTFAAEFVEVSSVELGYEFWSDREIRVRVPSGAASGNVKVQSLHGTSQLVPFQVTGMPGTKVFGPRRSFMFSYMVDVRVEQATVPNALYIWMPQPAFSAAQRNIRLTERNISPFVENHRGTMLFQLRDIPRRAVREIKLSYIVDVYAVETNITNLNPVPAAQRSPVHNAYTQASALIPSGNEEVRSLAAQIIGPERRPYAMARRIYDWLITSAGIQADSLPGGVLEALSENAADSYRAALLFCALARAVGIPAIPVSGILINSQLGTARHYWAEFWLDGFGWIPIDPALGAGAAPPDFDLREDHAQFYFGNMDNQRIAFSRGEHNLSQMTPNGRIVQRVREHSLQNLWEEASGGLESYTSLWSDVMVTGTFTH